MRDVINMNLTSFSTKENSLILKISMHTHKILFMRNSNNQSQTAAVTDFKNFISWSWIYTITQWIIRNIHNSFFVNFNTNNIFITSWSGNNNINNTILKSRNYSLWSWVIWDWNDFFWESFWPFFNEFWCALFWLPSL